MNYRYLIVLGLCFVLEQVAQAIPAKPDCVEPLIYLTDHPEQLEQTLRGRAHLYTPGLRNAWSDARADFEITATGEEVLVIKGFEVMRGFEKPYMASIARTASSRGGRVLNVGYGIGFIDSEIERLRSEFPITEHHIIELNREVADRALRWREQQPNRQQIYIHHGDWIDVLPELVARRIVFDAIAYDAFPLEAQELHRDFVPFLAEVIRLRAVRERTGLLTFYMDSSDGFGSRFTEHATQLGVGRLSIERVAVSLPVSGNQYWERDFFFTPSLTEIRYRR